MGMRFRMLETLREYASSQLAVDSAAHVHAAQASFFIDLVEGRTAEQLESRSRAWLQRLETERDNLREALDWLYQCDDPRELELVSKLFHVQTRKCRCVVPGDFQAALAEVRLSAKLHSSERGLQISVVHFIAKLNRLSRVQPA